MDNTLIPYTGILDSGRTGGWTLGGNYAPGLAIKTSVSYSVLSRGPNWYYSRIAYNGIDLGIQTIGPFPDMTTATQQMNNTKINDGTG